jgi:acyl carrier protein
MSEHDSNAPETRVTAVVQRLLAQRSIDQAVGPSDDLRRAGLTSLDMINLVLSVEEEFDITVPEDRIDPANFRSIDAISRLVAALLAGS